MTGLSICAFRCRMTVALLPRQLPQDPLLPPQVKKSISFCPPVPFPSVASLKAFPSTSWSSLCLRLLTFSLVKRCGGLSRPLAEFRALSFGHQSKIKKKCFLHSCQ